VPDHPPLPRLSLMLEMIDIGHDYAHWEAVPLGTLQFPLQNLQNSSPVPKAS